MPQVRSAAALFTGVMVVTSVMAAIVPPLGALIALEPGAVLTHPWQVVTYGFLATSPLSVIFGAIILFSLGGALERSWGTRRFVMLALGTTTLAGVATALLSLVWSRLAFGSFAGESVMTGALWVAYGMSLGARQTNFWGLPVTGNQLALIGVGFVVLSAAFAGLAVVVPSAFALLFAFMAVRGYTPGDWWLRLRSWQLSRQLSRRSGNLKVIAGEKRNMPGDSDRYLH